MAFPQAEGIVLSFLNRHGGKPLNKLDSGRTSFGWIFEIDSTLASLALFTSAKSEFRGGEVEQSLNFPAALHVCRVNSVPPGGDDKFLGMRAIRPILFGKRIYVGTANTTAIGGVRRGL